MSTELPSWIHQFPGNLKWSNATLVTKGMAPYAAVALGEIDDVCNRLRDRQDDPDAWPEEWSAMADRLSATADEAEALGHTLTAANYNLRAGMYYFTAERFIEPGAEKREMGRIAIERQTKGILARHQNIERVEVPYEGATLPALYVRAETGGEPAPTIVLFDGLDNCKEMSALFAGIPFAARGWNTLAIDGPGQGESLRLRDIKSRYDYEVAGTAAYEYVAARPEVDSERVAVMGYSFGGYYAPRIVAFEHRYMACVAFGAMHWDMVAWVESVKQKVEADPRTSSTSHFQIPWVFGVEDLDAAKEMAKDFELESVGHLVTCDLLVAHGENDRVVPLADAERLVAAIGSENKTLMVFTVETGGAEHVQVDNREVGIDAIADWLADRF